MRTFLLLAAAVLAVGCSHRVVHTYVKSGVNERQLTEDTRSLREAGGVDQVVPRVDSQGNATIELYLDEDSPEKGAERALQLGYRRVSL